jgi:hypothetical protein
MKPWQSRVCLAVAALALSSACSKSPAAPSVSFSGPLASQPVNGTTYRFVAQPVVLTITNSAKTGQAALTYSIEVATDPAFTNKVFAKDAIAEGSGGTTSVQLNSLVGGVVYYWRSKAVVDGVAGAMSAVQSFTVLAQVTLNAPGVVSPANGGTASSVRPSFSVSNATHTGPVGPITYEFQVSTSSSFSPLLATATVAEQAGGTSWTASTDLPAGTPLFWRVRARDDQNAELSAFSSSSAFSIFLFDVNNVTWLDNPNMSGWAETSKITSIDFSTGYIDVDFDRRQGPNQWPDVPFGDGGGGTLQYTLGMCFNLGGHWFCSAVIQFWNGRDLDASGPAGNVAKDWYYDARWGPMAGHQPAIGEQVGIFAANGNLRDSLSWGIEQRTDIVVVPFGTNYRASSGASIAIPQASGLSALGLTNKPLTVHK